MGMFTQIEKEARDKLIQFYEDFIKNPKDKSLKERASELDWEYTGVPTLSKTVINAAFNAGKIEFEVFSIEKAKKILEELKK